LGIEEWRFDNWDMSENNLLQSFHYGLPNPDWRARLAFATLGNIETELIENVQGQSGYRNFINKKGKGLRHLMFITEQMDIISEFAKSLNIMVSTEVIGQSSDSHRQKDG
jgi:hypothetical protein